MTEFKDANVLVESVQLDELLLCGVRACTATVLLRYCPQPAAVGWVLSKGWWLCPEHREANDE